MRRPATNQVLNNDVGRLSHEVMCLETFYFISGRLIRLRQERVMGTYSGENPLIRMTEARFYEPARLSTPFKPLLVGTLSRVIKVYQECI